MARPAAVEEMIIKSVYGPKRLLDRPNLSEVVVGLLEKDYAGKKPVDPIEKTFQTFVTDYVLPNRPSIIREWKSDDIRAEEVLRALAEGKKIGNVSSSVIGAVMTKLSKGETS